MGYSWGVRGFRIGRDSKGRLVRAMSIPGTGLYKREYLSGSDTKQPTTGRGCGCGGLIGASLGLLLLLLIYASIAANGITDGVILLFFLAGGYVAWRLLRRSDAPAIAVVGPPPNYEALGWEVKSMSVALSVPIKGELGKLRKAAAYDDLFEMTFVDLICHFAALDGPIDSAEAAVFSDIFKVLHPRKYGGLSPDAAVTILDTNRRSYPEKFQSPAPIPFLVELAERAGDPYLTNLRELMYRVAQQVALADGPLSPTEQSELESLRSGPGTGEQQRNGNSEAQPSVKAGEGTSRGADQIRTEGAGGRDGHPIVDPQFTTATGLVTIDILKEKVKELVDSLEPTVRLALVKLQQSADARLLVENDIRAIIIRFGASNGSISEYAAHLYLQLFRTLHPEGVTGWTVQNALSFLQSLLAASRDTYLGAPTKPFTLLAVELIDAEHGTCMTKSVRDFLLITAFFAASQDGIVSEAKTAEIVRMKAICEATQ